MSETNILSRSLHDIGLAGWFGGTLANAVALNPAAARAGSGGAVGAVVNEGWNRWTPINAIAIGAHLLGSVGQLVGNRDRLNGQRGVRGMAIAKTGLTAAALGATAWARVAGRTVAKQPHVPVADGTTDRADTPPDVAAAQRQLAALQWAIPALTGALVIVSSFAGEQQRPAAVLAGVASRFTS